MEALDLKHQASECIKVVKSFQYFLDNHGWIEDKVTSQAIPFKLWPAQVKILPLFLTALRLIILKARQLGLTWLTAAYCLWLAITRPLQLIIVISAKEDWAIEFLDRCKFILERLPEWMIPKITSNTKTLLEFMHIDEQGNPLLSTIKSLTTTPSGAQSKTPTLLVLDETARVENVKSIYASSKPGIDAAKARIILISNSIKDGVGWSWTRGIYQGAIQKINDFEKIFMPWWDHPGRTKNFIKEQMTGGMDEDDISQHYPATEQEAISTLLGSYFGKVLARHNHVIQGTKGRIEKTKQGDYAFIQDKKGILEIWHYPYFLIEKWDSVYWTNRYCIGGDIGEGLGQTYSTWYVIDRYLDCIVARMRSNRVDAYQWANLGYMLSKYYEKALICPERDGAGQTTVKRLLDLDANLYLQIIPDKVGPGVTRNIGWSQHDRSDSKHELCGDLKTWLRRMKGTLYDATLIDECSTFIRHEGGKLGAEEGKLDDCVIGAGCAVEASIFIGEKPETIKEGPTGWLKRHQAGEL